MLPSFAKPIADARAAGKRPAQMVLVSDGNHSLHNRFRLNPVCSIKEGDDPEHFDWRFLAGLDVEINTNGSAMRCEDLIRAILPAKPQGLWLRKIDTDTVTRVYFLKRIWMTPEHNDGSH